MSVGLFTLVKNEARFIGPHLAAWLPYVDQFSFFDGNSTDGTLEIIRDFQRWHPHGKKILLREDADPKDLRDDYVRLFTECLQALDTDWAMFCHPDMYPVNVDAIAKLKADEGIAQFCHMESFAGDPDGRLYKINGRADRWKNVMRLRRPDLELYYWGWYGAWNEDIYHRQVTGDAHNHYGADTHRYPYLVADSGLRVHHYSDVRPLARRIDRMAKCLVHQGSAKTYEQAVELAKTHPRVTLKDGGEFTFEPAEYHPIFKTWKETLSVHA